MIGSPFRQRPHAAAAARHACCQFRRASFPRLALKTNGADETDPCRRFRARDASVTASPAQANGRRRQSYPTAAAARAHYPADSAAGENRRPAPARWQKRTFYVTPASSDTLAGRQKRRWFGTAKTKRPSTLASRACTRSQYIHHRCG